MMIRPSGTICYNSLAERLEECSFVLALLAIIVLAPLLYIPGYLIGFALLGAAQPPDPLERYYERIVAGALLNAWLVFTLA